jgi:hypothetical protein
MIDHCAFRLIDRASTFGIEGWCKVEFLQLCRKHAGSSSMAPRCAGAGSSCDMTDCCLWAQPSNRHYYGRTAALFPRCGVPLPATSDQLSRSATMPRTAVYAKTSYYASWPQSIIVAFIADDPELRSGAGACRLFTLVTARWKGSGFLPPPRFTPRPIADLGNLVLR